MSDPRYVMHGPAASRALDTYHLIFAPTHACNLRCRHCYLPDHAAHLVPWEQVERLIGQWEEIVVRDRGVRGGYFHLKGGEPLILPYLNRVLDLLAEKKTLRFMMTTNGTMLPDGFLAALSRVNSALRGDAIIIVSLDGSCEEVHRILRGPNHFAQTESFAAALIDAGLNVHFNYVVHSGNLHDVSDFVTFAERIGANQVNFLPLVPKGYGLDLGEHSRPDPEKLHSLLSRLYCEGSEQRRRLLAGNYAHILDLERQGVQTANECVAGYKGLFYITPEGDVYSCPNLVGTSLRVGNYLETPLVELHDRGLDQLYRSRLHNPDLDERYLCRGERMSQSEARPSRLRSLPLLSAGAENRGYPDAARRLQEILLREGKATPSSGHGTSYCFSRNF